MTKKQEGCLELASKKQKKITRSDIIKVAENLGLSENVMRRAWRNLEQYGTTDLRRTQNGTKSLTDDQKKKTLLNNARYFKGLTKRNLYAKTARKIVREYVFTDIKAVELFKKHKITPHQFYNWLRELDVKGTIMGQKILDPTQYDKNHIKDIIKMRRRGYVEVNPERAIQYTRVITVLEFYL